MQPPTITRHCPVLRANKKMEHVSCPFCETSYHSANQNAASSYCCDRVTCQSLDAFVPQDSRTEWPLLRAGTTVFQSRVVPSNAEDLGPHVFRSRFLSLNIAHPCAVMIQYLRDHDYRTGTPHLLEYEVLRDVPLHFRNKFGLERTHHDELIFWDLHKATPPPGVTDTLFSLERTFMFDATVLRRGFLLSDVYPTDGFDGFDGQTTDRRVSPLLRDEAYTPISADTSKDVHNGIVAQGLGAPRSDRDYLLLRQFWQKGQRVGLYGTYARTLLAGAIGSQPVSPSVYRFAVVFYELEGAFDLVPPVVYRDHEPRHSMSNCVGILLILAERTHRLVEVLGCAIEPGYESRVTPLVDEALIQHAVPATREITLAPDIIEQLFAPGKLPKFKAHAAAAQIDLSEL